VIRVLAIVFFTVICLASFGNFDILASDFSEHLDMHESESIHQGGIAVLLAVTATALVTLWKAQVLLCDQILFSFFFYGWRNSCFDSISQGFNRFFKNLENEKSF
jgi:hypothetical protein